MTDRETRCLTRDADLGSAVTDATLRERLATLHRPLELIGAAILLLTGIAKLVAAAGADRIMELPDPILLLSNRTIFAAVGSLEILVALYLIRSANGYLKTLVLLWLVAAFTCYRLGWWLSEVREPCPCLGTGYGWWPWLQTNLHAVSVWIFALFALVALLRLVAQITTRP